MSGESEKPSILVLGGTGFIGRNMVDFLVTNDVASKIRVADKTMPAMAWLNDRHKNSFSKVEFKHANLINPKSVSNIFHLADDREFDYVVNCATETKPGQSEAVYKDGIVKLSCTCAKEAAKRHVKTYIEISSAYMQDSSKGPATEDEDCQPWKSEAMYKLQVEQELANISDLSYIIVRPALVYGHGATGGIGRRLVIGQIYKHLNEKLQLLWSEDLCVNTVHVDDVCKAVWHLCNHGQHGQIYNLADNGRTTQGKLASVISEIFDVNHDFLGTLRSTFAAKLSLHDIVVDINEKHMVAWGELCEKEGINNTPLSPVIHEEELLNKNLSVDGSKIENIGFTYEKPQITVELVREILDEYIKMKLFPAKLA